MATILHKDLTGDELHPPKAHTHPDSDLTSFEVLDARYKNIVLNETPGGTINNSNVVFTTANPYVASSTRLFLNGQRMQLQGDYVESGVQEITFIEAPQVGDILIIDYIKT